MEGAERYLSSPKFMSKSLDLEVGRVLMSEVRMQRIYICDYCTLYNIYIINFVHNSTNNELLNVSMK